jgi:hypothetical protein
VQLTTFSRPSGPCDASAATINVGDASAHDPPLRGDGGTLLNPPFLPRGHRATTTQYLAEFDRLRHGTFGEHERANRRS